MSTPKTTPKEPKGMEALATLISTHLIIVAELKQFVESLYQTATTKCSEVQAVEDPTLSEEAWDPPSSIDALKLAHDAATLIRAHATKISLLIINEPFTPSAIHTVVYEMMNGPVPALVRSVNECYGPRYSYHVQRALARRCSGVLTQVENLLSSIPQDGKALNPKETQTIAGSSRTDRGAYTGIGILWSQCDDVIALGKNGVAGFSVHLVQEVYSTLLDQMEELRTWGEETSDDEFDNDDDDDDDEAGSTDGGSDAVGEEHASMQAIVDDLMSSGGHIPPDDPDKLRPRLELTLKKIKLSSLLCSAVIKRRLNCLPALPTEKPSNVATRLHNTLLIMQELPDRIGKIIEAFYELDTDLVDANLSLYLNETFISSELLLRSWNEKEDPFTGWVIKFQGEMRNR